MNIFWNNKFLKDVKTLHEICVFPLMGKFKAYNVECPPQIQIDVNSVIPSNHPVRFIEQAVSNLDLCFLEAKYSSKGQSAFHPSMMLSILFLGYMLGIRSGGGLSKACRENLLFIYISRGYQPSKTTINDFRLANYKYFEAYFVQIIDLCQQASICEVEKSIYDGTKINAHSSSKQIREKATYERWLDYLQADIIELEQQIAQLTQQNQAVSAIELKHKELKKKSIT